MRTLKNDLEHLEGEIATIHRRQAALQFEASDFPELDQLKKEIRPVLQLWETIEQFDGMLDRWRTQPLREVKHEELEHVCEEWKVKINACKKNELLN